MTFPGDCSAPAAGRVRRILHVDMDAFYTSVEQRDDPLLRGRPVAVGGSPESRGVVAAASYEARKYGVRSALPMSRAVRLCPELVILRPDFAKYRAVSERVFQIFREVTPLVEGLSLDEAYLDVTENAWGIPLGVDVARRIKTRICEDTGLTASAGVAPNKFLAKIASGWKKPDGLTVIAPERVEAFLQKLPVDALWGVGPVTAKRLRAAGIDRLVDVRAASEETLRGAVGSLAEWLRRLAHGDDDRAVEPDRERKSIGSEETYARDLTEMGRIREEVARLAEASARFLEKKELAARTVVLKLRYSTFQTITRSETRRPATRSADEVRERALALIDKTEAGARPVRLLGVSLHNLEDGSAPAPPDGQPALELADDGSAAGAGSVGEPREEGEQEKES
ncbi:MAG: DNA polymerase IV [Acidobacteria bacterium]|nr:DNA polymerase IV [Acidobacteriota bacterium]MCA1609679.1 DNA polymerase IV [Acidobacteriota bacterium]